MLSVIDFNKSLKGVSRVEKKNGFIGSKSSYRLVHCLCLFADNWCLHRLFLACGLHWVRGSWSCTMALFLDTVSLSLHRRMGRNSSNKTVTSRNPKLHPPRQFFLQIPLPLWSILFIFFYCPFLFFHHFFFDPVFHKLRVIFDVQLEAEYTYQLHKDIIPLMMDYKYKPDGWLGIIVGTKFWIDFTERHKVDSNVEKLVKELGSRGKIVLGETIQGTECSLQIITVCFFGVLFRLRFYAIRALLLLTDSNKTLHRRN